MNVWLSMMSGHDAKPTFFNKKNKDWTSRTLANPHPPTSNNISFLPYLPPTHAPSKWTLYVCHPLCRFGKDYTTKNAGKNEVDNE